MHWSDLNRTTNEELARLLHRREPQKAPLRSNVASAVQPPVASQRPAVPQQLTSWRSEAVPSAGRPAALSEHSAAPEQPTALLAEAVSGTAPQAGVAEEPTVAQQQPEPALRGTDALEDADAVSEAERVALFAALSKGSKAGLGREPTVAEFMLLVGEVYRARAVAASAQSAIQGSVNVYVKDGSLVFGTDAPEA